MKEFLAKKFKEQKESFTLLSSDFINYVHDNLKLLINEMNRPKGGFAWRIDGKNKRMFVHLYSDGMVLLYPMIKENNYYPELNEITPTICSITTPEGVDKTLEKMKEFFSD